MATMPALLNYPVENALYQLGLLAAAWTITYQAVSPPHISGIVLAQSPSAGQTITGTVSLIVAGALTLPGGTQVFSQPVIFTSDDTPP